MEEVEHVVPEEQSIKYGGMSLYKAISEILDDEKCKPKVLVHDFFALFFL